MLKSSGKSAGDWIAVSPLVRDVDVEGGLGGAPGVGGVHAGALIVDHPVVDKWEAAVLELKSNTTLIEKKVLVYVVLQLTIGMKI